AAVGGVVGGLGAGLPGGGGWGHRDPPAVGIIGPGGGVGGEPLAVTGRVACRARRRRQGAGGDAHGRHGLREVSGTVVAAQRRVADRVGDHARVVVRGVGGGGREAARAPFRRLVAVRVVAVDRLPRRDRGAAASAQRDRRLLAVSVVRRDGRVVAGVRAGQVRVRADHGRLLAVAVVAVGGGGE